MAKNYSKGAKRRAKKELPGLAPVERREKDGRVQRSTRPDYERAPEDKVLRARARQMGKPEQKKSKMKAEALAFAAGRAIYSIHEGKPAARLWDAYTRLTDAEARYLKHATGLSLYAKTARLEYLPERFEARDDDSPDMRTDDEKFQDASNKWRYWRGLVMHLSCFQQTCIFDVAYGRLDPMDAGGITSYGGRFVEALERFADVVDEHQKRLK
jgi:hypothetical protein